MERTSNFPDHKDGWGVCGSAGYGRHNRTYVIETECFSLNNCPKGYLNNGAECPPEESKICAVDCVSHHEEWSPCDNTTGTQSRGVVITTQPVGGGASCLKNESRQCKVDCSFSWKEWTPCNNAQGGKSVQQLSILLQNGYNGEGKGSQKEEQNCGKLRGRLLKMDSCTSPSGNYPSYTKSRAW